MAYSLRAGGASLAANKGIPDGLFKRHGQWKSNRAKDDYVEDDLKIFLSFEKSSKLSPFTPTLNHKR